MVEQASSFKYENGRDRVRQRGPVACSHCRARKIRCSGDVPCANCVDRGEQCVMASTRRRAKQTQQETGAEEQVHNVDELLRQIEKLKAIIRESSTSPGDQIGGCGLTTTAGTTITDTAHGVVSTRTSPTGAAHTASRHKPDRGKPPGTWDVYYERQVTPLVQSSGQPGHNRPANCTPQKVVFVQENPGRESGVGSSNGDANHHVTRRAHDEEGESSSIFTAGLSSLEYYGPRCFMSFCSSPGIEWVHARVGTSEARAIANRLVMSVTSMIKIDETLASERAEPLAPDLAWCYTTAYFEEAPETVFGVVDRDWFQARLHAHFEGTKPDDKIFYALRNIIWATGCRILLSRTSTNKEACRASRALFDNAMSVYTELLFSRTSITAVQALIVMAYYCEGLGTPSIQYTVCSNAIRLACSKGLHRQPPSSWNMSRHEVDRRNWLFWSIYCLEKQIAVRSGRPSAIEDDEISCQIPKESLNGCPAHTFFCHTLIDMTRVLSTAMKRLSSVKALRQTQDQLARVTRDLGTQLDRIRSSCEHLLSDKGVLDASVTSQGLSLTQVLAIRSNYACLVLVVNTPLADPWTELQNRQHTVNKVHEQYEKSCAAVASAARATILSARHIPISPSCPDPIAMYAPVYSFLSLFIHILRDAKSPTVQADMAIMEMAMGYFSGVEFATDFAISLPWVKDIVQLARLAVEQAEHRVEGSTIEAVPPTRSTSINTLVDEPVMPSGEDSIDMMDTQIEGNDVEIWGTFLHQWEGCEQPELLTMPGYGMM